MLKACKGKSNILLKLLIFSALITTLCPLYGAEPTETVSEDQLQTLRFQANAEDIHIWDRYVRRFRRDHHLAVTSGWDRGTWHLGSFGRLIDIAEKSEGVDSTFQYSFHLHIFGKFGYYLGSSAGYYAEMRLRGDNDFGPSSMWKLPGLVAGLVYNYDATGRFFLGTDIYLSRIVRLETRNIEGDSQTIAVTGETIDFVTGWDKFVSLSWGIRFQAYDRRLWVPAPREAAGHPVDARIKRTSRGASVGTVYHFL